MWSAISQKLLSYGTSRSADMLGSDVGTRGKKIFPLEKNYSGSGRKSSQAYLSTDFLYFRKSNMLK